MKKVLFLCEHATWSQIVRSVVLARGLDRTKYEVHFACGSFDPRLFSTEDFTRWPLESISPKKIEASLASGDRLYEKSVLNSYVEAELKLYTKVQPDLVISDLRWSTAISAPVAGVPCASIVNAFWSPFAIREKFPLPDHPILKLVGVATAEKYFPIALPKVLDHFAKPVNELRRKYRLSEIGNLHEIITWGDRTLFPDDPDLVPLSKCPSHHVYLGPVLWSAPAPLPVGFEQLGKSRPLVYATLGSSGDMNALPSVVAALGKLPVDALVATAGRRTMKEVPSNVVLVDTAPGSEVAKKADLVICNGGASTAYQALAEGTPVIGLPSNLDQFFAMTCIRDAGAGIMVRASVAHSALIEQSVLQMLNEPSYKQCAVQVAESFSKYNIHEKFDWVLSDILQPRLSASGEN